jgi:hypothetical protein
MEFVRKFPGSRHIRPKGVAATVSDPEKTMKIKAG